MAQFTLQGLLKVNMSLFHAGLNEMQLKQPVFLNLKRGETDRAPSSKFLYTNKKGVTHGRKTV
jgi:hypothetical protein